MLLRRQDDYRMYSNGKGSGSLVLVLKTFRRQDYWKKNFFLLVVFYYIPLFYKYSNKITVTSFTQCK